MCHNLIHFMIYLSKPTEASLLTFLESQTGLPYTYPEEFVGTTDSKAGILPVPPGYDTDHNRVCLGSGEAVFRDACVAMRAWRTFPAPWTQIYPPNVPLVEKQIVVVLFHLFGLWWRSSARIVYSIDEERRFGFAYGTLPGHIERGEERFLIEWHTDDTVWYDLRSFSKPRLWFVKLGYPLVRMLQKRFVRDSQAAMRL
jgi:uncharacterized protein (UPF0548 family)